MLSIAVGAAAAWPLLVIGVVFPKQAALVLALLPLPEQTPASLVRVVWIVLAVATPVGVGWIMARSAPPSRGGGWRRLLLGFPATLGLGLAFLVACVAVPITKLAAFAARKKEEHVALVVPPEEYEPTADSPAEGPAARRSWKLRGPRRRGARASSACSSTSSRARCSAPPCRTTSRSFVARTWN